MKKKNLIKKTPSIEIKDARLQGFRISKDFDILVDGDIQLTFNKYIYEDEVENENDYTFDDESKIIFDKLDEEKQEEVINFINNIQL
jgi:hypothetical protein